MSAVASGALTKGPVGPRARTPPVWVIPGDTPPTPTRKSASRGSRGPREGGGGPGKLGRGGNCPGRVADWGDLAAGAGSVSLFGDRKILGVRFSGKAGKEGSAVLQRLIDMAGEDTLLLVITPRLDTATQSTARVNAIQSPGSWLPIRETTPRPHHPWLCARWSPAVPGTNPGARPLPAVRI